MIVNSVELAYKCLHSFYRTTYIWETKYLCGERNNVYGRVPLWEGANYSGRWRLSDVITLLMQITADGERTDTRDRPRRHFTVIICPCRHHHQHHHHHRHRRKQIHSPPFVRYIVILITIDNKSRRLPFVHVIAIGVISGVKSNCYSRVCINVSPVCNRWVENCNIH